VGVVEADLPGGKTLRMWSRGDDDIAGRVFWLGWAGHEPEVAVAFHDLAASARLTLDIGAHVGYFTLIAALANPGGRVFAFEPLDRIYERLTYNVVLNGLRNVKCLKYAIGSKSGVSQFFHVSHGIPSSSSLSKEFIDHVAKYKPLVCSPVEVMTVDDFVYANNLHGVDLVKIDTETTEPSVLQGMLRTLETDRPSIICEVLDSGPAAAIEEILASFEYEFFLLTTEGAKPCQHLKADPRWHNYLLTPSPK
jgi:FkbM family methyltransferase